jgi:predicted NAD/FAD-dependent oxidoreductase
MDSSVDGKMTAQRNTLIIGAGISGLLAGQVLSRAGHPVTILEKSRGVGGRMATRRFKNGVFDHGAQFFTVRDPQFQDWVDLWVQQGIAFEWSRSFSKPGDVLEASGHPRYRGASGMTAIPKELSRDLDIYLNTHVKSISRFDELWNAEVEDGNVFGASQLILTAPVPQSLSLLKTGGVSLAEQEMVRLQSIQYHPCIAVLVLLNGPSKIPPPGGIKLDSSPIQWLADNTQKGISPKTTAVTIHAAADFSHQNFDQTPDQLADTLVTTAKPWLGDDIQDWQLHKWRYSQPAQIYPERFLEIQGSPSLFFAGDGFGGPRVEGAALSGMAVAFQLLERLRR